VRLLVPGTDLSAAVGDDLPIAVGLEADGLDADAAGRGADALARLGEALIALGAARHAAGRSADVSTLVPEYVALPRGVTDAAREVAWSPDLR
jgi:hypothetical protein